MDEITGDHQCAFQHNRLTTGQIFRIVRYSRKMGVQWDSTSAIHRPKKRLEFSLEESTVQYSHRVYIKNTLKSA
jgi:hypothetical protein